MDGLFYFSKTFLYPKSYILVPDWRLDWICHKFLLFYPLSDVNSDIFLKFEYIEKEKVVFNKMLDRENDM